MRAFDSGLFRDFDEVVPVSYYEGCGFCRKFSSKGI